MVLSIPTKASITVVLVQDGADPALNLSSGGSSDGLLTEVSTPEGDQSGTVGPTTWSVILGNVCLARVQSLHSGVDLHRYKMS